MDRASDSGSEGWGFESLPAYHRRGKVRFAPAFFCLQQKKTPSTHSLAPPLQTGPAGPRLVSFCGHLKANTAIDRLIQYIVCMPRGKSKMSPVLPKQHRGYLMVSHRPFGRSARYGAPMGKAAAVKI